MRSHAACPATLNQQTTQMLQAQENETSGGGEAADPARVREAARTRTRTIRESYAQERVHQERSYESARHRAARTRRKRYKKPSMSYARRKTRVQPVNRAQVRNEARREPHKRALRKPEKSVRCPGRKEKAA